MTATLNLVLSFLALPKSTSGTEGKKPQEANQDSGTEQPKKKGKSIDKTVKKVWYEESGEYSYDDSDSFDYESAPDTLTPPKRRKKAHGLPWEVSSESDEAMDEVTIRAAFQWITEYAKPAARPLHGRRAQDEEVGKPITESSAKIASGAVQYCPAEEHVKKLVQKYPRPSNMPNLAVPKTNSDMWEAMTKEPVIVDGSI